MSGLAKSIKGNSNIYTQHQPLLQDVLAQIKKNKLSEADYPFEGASGSGTPNVVVVFYVGGTTYEEAHVVSEWNAEGTMQVVLGGNDSYIAMCHKCYIRGIREHKVIRLHGQH